MLPVAGKGNFDKMWQCLIETLSKQRKGEKRLEFSSWFVQRLFVCNCLKLCKPWVPQWDSSAGLDGFPPARGGACAVVLGAFESTLTTLQWFLWPQTLCKTYPCPVVGFLPPLTRSSFCQLGPALSKHHIFIPTLVSVLERFVEGDVAWGRQFPYILLHVLMSCVCHSQVTQHVAVQMSFMVCYAKSTRKSLITPFTMWFFRWICPCLLGS